MFTVHQARGVNTLMLLVPPEESNGPFYDFEQFSTRVRLGLRIQAPVTERDER